jgi:hypothetical protein
MLILELWPEISAENLNYASTFLAQIKYFQFNETEHSIPAETNS